MYAAELQIDHVTVAGPRLEELRQAFTRSTTFPTEYGGPHANHATEMALTSFPDGSYLEFIAIQPHADPAAVAAHTWGQFIRGNAGPCAFAVRAMDVTAQIARMKALGLQVQSPEESGRTRPDGTRLEWETVDLGAGPRGSFFPFLIRDKTPRDRRVYISGKPTTDRATGISKVVIGVQNLEEAIAQYRHAFELRAPKLQIDSQFDAKLAWFEGTPIVLAQGTSDASWLTRRVHQYGNSPAAFIVRVPGGLAGALASRWFDSTIFWASDTALGWRFGQEVSNPQSSR